MRAVSFALHASALRFALPDLCNQILDQQSPATIFATQLDGTRQNRPVRRRGEGRVLGPKTLTERHVPQQDGMALAVSADRLITCR